MTDSQDKLLPLYLNGKHIGRIAFEDAMRSAKDGGVELTTKGQGRKWRITAVHLAAARLPHPSPCTLTRSDSEHNALAYLGAHLDPTQSMREFDRAVAKVAAWPEVHDDKAPVISAGKVFGATFLELDDSRVVTFA